MQNFEARKRLLDYDDVMNQQREVIYDLRLFALEGGEDLKGEAWDMIEQTLDRLLEEHAPEGSHAEDWDLYAAPQRLLLDYFLVADQLPQDEGGENDFHSVEELEDYLVGLAASSTTAKLSSSATTGSRCLRYVGAQHHRREVEGSPVRPRPPEGLHRLPWLGSEGPAGRVQAGGLLDMFVDLLTDIQSSIARLTLPRPTGDRAASGAAGVRRHHAPGPRRGSARHEHRPGACDRQPPPDGLGMGVNPMAAVRSPQPQQMTTNRDEPKPQQPVSVGDKRMIHGRAGAGRTVPHAGRNCEL
jgi:preprotein translocase subunit SecA